MPILLYLLILINFYYLSNFYIIFKVYFSKIRVVLNKFYIRFQIYILMSYHYNFVMNNAFGPFMRKLILSMIRRNPALDRLPVSRVARGGKGNLPMIQES